jgi:hypothetical protein
MKLKLRDALESKQPTINEGVLGKLMNAIWTLTGTKGGLFKAIQLQYGEDATKYKKELTVINDKLQNIHNELQAAMNLPENKR